MVHGVQKCVRFSIFLLCLQYFSYFCVFSAHFYFGPTSFCCLFFCSPHTKHHHFSFGFYHPSGCFVFVSSISWTYPARILHHNNTHTPILMSVSSFSIDYNNLCFHSLQTLCSSMLFAYYIRGEGKNEFVAFIVRSAVKWFFIFFFFFITFFKYFHSLSFWILVYAFFLFLIFPLDSSAYWWCVTFFPVNFFYIRIVAVVVAFFFVCFAW